MNILVIQNDPIVPVGQLSAFLGGHEVIRAWEDPQRLQDLAAAPLPPSSLVAAPVRGHARDRLSPGDNNGRSDGNSAP